ncbi:MAG: SDR family oxidoreductase [Magnetococcales bacterium]|nr:SDR family oxidoreductase [Magnetococcales bacterium]
MSQEQENYRALMAKALLEIKGLKTRLKTLEEERSEPIAIIGYGCRFPGGADNPEGYWHLLQNGIDAIVELPKSRWDISAYHDPDMEAPGKICTRNGGFLPQIDSFDAPFFGISPREAESLDPQQRLLLEVSWEALENANLVPERLFNSRTGVFVGVCSLDHAIRLMGEGPLDAVDAYHGTGCAFAPVAGRISFFFGFTGPSFIVDTACSSSLLSLHLACESLRRRECDLALGSGVHLLTHPGYSITFSKAHMLSVDGRCKTFDAAANGYTRGEGCGVLVLKRLADAKRDGDVIRALIRGSAVNQDGPSGGFTVPRGPAQEDVIRQALARANLDPSQVSYIEAHGTGTSLGDPIEMSSLGNVFGPGHSKSHPLRVASVKTNIGHLEGAAGVAGVIKVVLALQHRALPPHLHLKNPSPFIPWKDIPVEIPTRLTPWEVPGGGLRVAGISSFGFSGTNVHLVLSEPEPSATDALASPPIPQPPMYLLPLAAKSEDALHALANRYATETLRHEDVDLAAVTWTAGTARTLFRRRLAVVAADREEARTRLAAFAAGRLEEGIISGTQSATDGPPKVGFLFTGQGSQYSGMGRQLYETSPLVRDTLNQCDSVLKPLLGRSLLEVLFAPEQAAELDQTGNTQPAMFALEVALARLWQSWGVEPVAMLGHSVGEYAAACVAGLFTLEEGLHLIAARARGMQSLPAGGAMSAILADEATVSAVVATHGDALSVAGVNGPRNTVISGTRAAVDQVVAHFTGLGITCRPLQVSHAFHSALMDPMLEAFRTVANQIPFKTGTIPVIANVDAQLPESRLRQGDYWVEHVRRPVRFADGMIQMAARGCNLFVEIGPRPTLLGMGKGVLETTHPAIANDPGAWLPSLRKGDPAWRTVLAALGGYFVRGGPVKWETLGRGRTTLPTYPFQRRRHWREVIFDGGGTPLHGEARLEHPLLGRWFRSPLLTETLFETLFSKKNLPFLEDHRIFGELVVAGASHISLVLGAGQQVLGTAACQLRDIYFPQALVVPEEGERTVQLVLKAGEREKGSEFRLVSFAETNTEPNLHATGRLLPTPATDATPREVLANQEAIWNRCGPDLDPETVYATQAQRQIVVGPGYRWLRALRVGNQEAMARLCAPTGLESVVSRYQLHPGLIDSCFGLLVMTLAIDVEESFIPFSMEAVHFHRPPGNTNLWAYARLRPEAAAQGRLLGDMHIVTEHGERVADFIGLEGRKAGREALLQNADHTRWLYQVQWQPLPPSSQPAAHPTGTWLLLENPGDGAGAALAARLQQQGCRCLRVFPGQTGSALHTLATDQYTLDPEDAQAFGLLRQTLDKLPLTGVVHLWSSLPANRKVPDEKTPDGKAPDTQAPDEKTPDAQAPDGKAPDTGDLHSRLARTTGSALFLLQELLKMDPVPRLFLVTRGAQGVVADDMVAGCLQTPLWGLARSLAVEHPELRSVCVDLESLPATSQAAGAAQAAADLSAPAAMEGLLTALAAPEAEQQLAWRDNRLYVSRLQPHADPLPPEVTLPAAATYLLSGGCGGLGLEVAGWLVERGAQNLVLLGRTPPNARVQETIANWTQKGVTIQTHQVDVSDAAALAATFRAMTTTLPPLRGIFHLAGQLEDGLLATLPWSRFALPLAAKLIGGWNLHQVSLDQPLDFFVCFSSITALLGNPSQGNYAAANAGLDGLIHYRRAAGLPGLSLNWGPWGEVGMAARLDQASRKRLAEQGLTLIPPTVGLRLLGRLLAGRTAQVGVLPIDWNRYAPATASPFTAHMVATGKDQKTTTSGAEGLLNTLKASQPRQRRDILQTYLARQVGQVLRLEQLSQIEPRGRLFDLGIDSLMALELKSRLQKDLQVTLSSTLLFDYPTLEALLNHLLDDLLADKLASPPEPDAGREPTQAPDLSEAEAEAALLDQLDKLGIS